MKRIALPTLVFLVMLAASRAASAASPAPAAPASSASGASDGATKDTTPSKSSVASAPGDYVGDCFKVGKALPAAYRASKGEYFVSGQSKDDDPKLTLIAANPNGWSPTCKPDPDASADKTVNVPASALIESGATRVGYAYGALTMPYKYYPRGHSFTVGAPIGAYLGLRHGLAGSGHTYALAITLSSVKADTLDPKNLVDGKPAVTGTTDVAALSVAAGVMYDIMKSTSGKPFKAGLFVGVDRVNQSSTVSFPQNGKPWIALQLGYDFTDN